MKVGELYSRPLKEILDNCCEMVDMNIHPDKDGNIAAIELKYIPKKECKGSDPIEF